MHWNDLDVSTIAERLARPGPSCAFLRAPSRWDGRSRATALLRTFDGAVHHLRAEVGDGSALRERTSQTTEADVATSWTPLFSSWLTEVENARAPVLWWISDADRLEPAAWEALLTCWREVRAQALPVQLVAADYRTEDQVTPPPALAEAAPTELRLGLPSLASLTREMDRWAPDRRIAALVIFGRDPFCWRHVDTSVRLSTNVHRLLLDPEGPLHRRELDRVRGTFQRPDRFLAILEALAHGPADWGTLRARAPGFATSSQLGPYLSTLEENHLVVRERSLDAPASSRARRYRISDPHTAFWFGCLLPIWDRVGIDRPSELWNDGVRPRLGAVARWVMPQLVREWLSTDAAERRLGSRARESGGLWGEGYDFPVAATLASGGVIYGRTRWDRGDVEGGLPEQMREEVRATRYGFGRESRRRLVVQRDPPSYPLARKAAREENLILLSAEDLVGDR